MFHSSESILITSDKRDSQTSLSQPTILHRKRASTWSDSHQGERSGMASGVNAERRRISHRRQRSQNSSLDHHADQGINNVNDFGSGIIHENHRGEHPLHDANTLMNSSTSIVRNQNNKFNQPAAAQGDINSIPPDQSTSTFLTPTNQIKSSSHIVGVPEGKLRKWLLSGKDDDDDDKKNYNSNNTPKGDPVVRSSSCPTSTTSQQIENTFQFSNTNPNNLLNHLEIPLKLITNHNSPYDSNEVITPRSSGHKSSEQTVIRTGLDETISTPDLPVVNGEIVGNEESLTDQSSGRNTHDNTDPELGTYTHINNNVDNRFSPSSINTPEYPPNLNIVSGPVDSRTWTEGSLDMTLTLSDGESDNPGQKHVIFDAGENQSQNPRPLRSKGPPSLVPRDLEIDSDFDSTENQQQSWSNDKIVMDDHNRTVNESEKLGLIGSSSSISIVNSKNVESFSSSSWNEDDNLFPNPVLIETRPSDIELPLRKKSLASNQYYRDYADPNDPIEKCFTWCLNRCCGSNIPHKLSWSRVSSAVVRYAPCFWIGCWRLETSATDRMLLTRLNMLSAVFSLMQFGVGVFILVTFLSESIVDRVDDTDTLSKYREALSVNLWMGSGNLLFLAFVGLILFITMILAIPVIRQVNLLGAIRFMWVLYWMIPLQIVLVIALFDYHNVTEVWIKHWWSSSSMAWFRQMCCAEGTANRECAIPYYSREETQTANDWCMKEFNATNCQEIRNEAVSKMSEATLIFIYVNCITGAIFLFVLLLSLGLLENIISAPIVQRSKEANIPGWLTFPALGCFAIGFSLLFSPQSLVGSNNEGVSSVHWIGVSYIVTGAMFALSILLGWFISAKTVLDIRDKRQKEVAVYIFILVLIFTIVAVGVIFTVCLMYTLNIVEVPITDAQRGIIACYVDQSGSCTDCQCSPQEIDDGICNPAGRQCPQWTTSDVTRIVATQLKQSNSLSAIFAIYALTALRFGFILRSSVSKYEIDYV